MLKLLLYTHDPEVQQHYLKALPEEGAMAVVVSDFKEFFKESNTIPCSGVLLDVVSSIRASQFDREVIQELLEVYPSLRLRLDPATGEIRTLMTGAGPGQNISIRKFVETYCSNFPPRCLRMCQRKPIHCNVIYSFHDQLASEVVQRSVTMDMSIGGCFLMTTEALEVGERLWIRIIELMDNSPIMVEVRWCREWGQKMVVPGVGLHFSVISDRQREEIRTLLDGD
ncbi:PilZ domain-containing protein [Desulfuromonas acetoxidans]|uniref:PilZ domain-containing protein n=1 Tax=Desulfuromonas acetoxidans TaxID=891 RepID=UPI00292E272A|nr:PilZ domain-containing protein [Desulfuromonas acetoxidans]